MRKGIIGLLVLTSIVMSGCTKETVVIQENTKSEQMLEKRKITERKVEDTFQNMAFEPKYYSSEGVYGLLSSTKLNVSISPDLIDQPYLVDINGKFQELESNFFSKEEVDLLNINNNKYGKYYGIYSEGLHTRDRKYYYADIFNDIKIPIEGYENYIYEAEDNKETYDSNGVKVNDDYYIDLFNIHDKAMMHIKNQKITLIDIKSEKVYSTEIPYEKYAYFYYDNNENCIMAIDIYGKVAKLTIENDTIHFEEYKTIDLKGSNLTISNSLIMFNSFRSGDYLLLGLFEGSSIKYGLYNIYSSEVIIQDKFVKCNVVNSDFFITSYNGEFYLSEINEGGVIELLYKIGLEADFHDLIAIANEEESSIFLSKFKYSTGENPKNWIEDIDYSFIEIE